MSKTGAQTTVGTTFLRASIVLDDKNIDVQIPADYPVEASIYEAIRFIKDTLVEQSYVTDWLSDPDAEWTLEKFGRRQLDGNLSLAEQGVSDGDRLWLVKNARNETYPALIDDLAEAVVQGQEAFPEWSYEVDGVKFASITLGALTSLACLTAAFVIGWSPTLAGHYRWEVVAGTGVFAVLFSVLAALLLNGEPSLLGNSLLTTGYVATGVTAFLAVPRPPGLWHFAVVGSVTLVYAAIMMALARGPIRIHAGVVTVALIITFTSMFNLYYQFSPSVIAAQMVTAGVLLTLPVVGKVSMIAGRVETPYVFAAGEPLTDDEASLADLNRGAASAKVIESAISQKEKNYAAHQYFMGIITGAMVVVVVGTAFMAFFPSGKPWGAFALTVGAASSIMFNGRYHIDRDVHGAMLAGSGATMASYILALSVGGAYHNITQIIAAGILSASVVSVGCLWTLGRKTINTPTVRRMFELIQYPFYSLPVLSLVWLMDLLMKVRNR